jgi:hypothetical protein
LFDGCGQLPLMLGTGSGNAPGKDLATIGNEAAQGIDVPIAHLGFLAAKLAVLAPVERAVAASAASWSSGSGVAAATVVRAAASSIVSRRRFIPPRISFPPVRLLRFRLCFPFLRLGLGRRLLYFGGSGRRLGGLLFFSAGGLLYFILITHKGILLTVRIGEMITWIKGKLKRDIVVEIVRRWYFR